MRSVATSPRAIVAHLRTHADQILLAVAQWDDAPTKEKQQSAWDDTPAKQKQQSEVVCALLVTVPGW